MTIAKQKIAPCLWYDDQAEQAAKFYVSVFKNSKVGRIAYYSNEGKEIHGHDASKVLTVEFELEGQKFLALNGGPQFKFSEAISLQVFCDTQQEIDRYWSSLSAGGDEQAQQCGWLKDRYGLSWQIVPSALPRMMTGDIHATGRVMKALLKMKKLDLAALERAHAG